MELDAAAERRHTGPSDPAWHEVVDLTFRSPRATFGGHVTLFLWPSAGRCWYWTSVVEEGRRPVALLDTDVALPRRALELRASGLWADHNCETPFEHWSYGLEAFAVRLDEPDDALGEFRGERVPLGYDLEWEAEVRGLEVRGLGAGRAAGDGYRQPGRVHGEVLIGPDVYELDGPGVRRHWWGTAWWPSDIVAGEAAAADPGPMEVVGRSLARLPVPGGPRLVGRRLERRLHGAGWVDESD